MRPMTGRTGDVLFLSGGETERTRSTRSPGGGEGRVRGLPLVITALVLCLLLPPPAAAGLADRVGATFGLMLQDVIDAFPPIEGIVVAADGDRLYVDLSERDGVQPGQEFTVFRKGKVFRHPVSQKPLGRYEEILGYAQVQRALPRFSQALYIAENGRPAPAAEDGVRITRGRIRAAVAPMLDLTAAGADLRRVPFMIALALDRSKRFQTADPTTVRDLLLNQSVRVEEILIRPERAVALGRSLEIAGWLVSVILERRGVTYLDVTWISAVTGRALFSRRLALVQGDSVADQRFPWEPLPQD